MPHIARWNISRLLEHTVLSTAPPCLPTGLLPHHSRSLRCHLFLPHLSSLHCHLQDKKRTSYVNATRDPYVGTKKNSLFTRQRHMNSMARLHPPWFSLRLLNTDMQTSCSLKYQLSFRWYYFNRCPSLQGCSLDRGFSHKKKICIM